MMHGMHGDPAGHERSEEHTSELQSRGHLVCRLLLEKKINCRLTDRPALLRRLPNTLSFVGLKLGCRRARCWSFSALCCYVPVTNPEPKFSGTATTAS